MRNLSIYLDPKSKTKLYEQIYKFIVSEIRSGKLLRGEKLPSTRSLAQSLGISRSTADYAYEQLEAEGYIEARPYKGFYVCGIDELLTIESDRKPEEKSALPENSSDKGVQIDFSLNNIDMSFFPSDTWRKLTRNTLNDDRLSIFTSGDSQGDLSLRETICDYLRGARGVNARAGNIIIGAGNDYLLMLLKFILGDGRKVAMENPTYLRAYKIFRALGYEVCSMKMDRQGLITKDIDKKDVDLVYVMPTHQYPTGTVMPIGRRMELLSWAIGENRYIIEDDYDGEFRYSGKPIPSLHMSDRNGRVIYIGTFSKSIAPSIRISYMVLPDELMRVYREKCAFMSSPVSRIEQATLREFIAGGHFERYLNKLRKNYRDKYELLMGGLRRMPGFKVIGANAGLHILLTSDHLTGTQMAAKALKMNIKIYPLSDFMFEENPGELVIREDGAASLFEAGDPFIDNTVVLGFGGLSVEQIKAGLKLLKICLR